MRENPQAAKKYFKHFSAFEVPVILLSSTLSGVERTGFTLNEREFDNKVAESVSSLVQLSRHHQFVCETGKQVLGIAGKEWGRNLTLQSGKITAYKGFQLSTN